MRANNPAEGIEAYLSLLASGEDVIEA